jgi:hypothetical protein
MYFANLTIFQNNILAVAKQGKGAIWQGVSLRNAIDIEKLSLSLPFFDVHQIAPGTVFIG